VQGPLADVQITDAEERARDAIGTGCEEAIRALFRVVNRYVGNLAPMPRVFPDYPAPVVRNAGTERELVLMRWGMPPPHHRQLATGVGVADDRCGIIREDTGHRRQVADIAVDHAEQRDDGGLVGGDAVEIAHFSAPRGVFFRDARWRQAPRLLLGNGLRPPIMSQKWK